jgi:ribosome-associated protein
MAAFDYTVDDLRPWIACRFDTAGGPGGQHVNKTSTRATVLFDIQSCALLSDAQKRRIVARLKSRVSRDGELRVVSQKERSQSANRQAAEARLLELVRDVLTPVRPRKPTRPTAGSVRRRLAEKRRRSERKSERRFRPSADE